MLKEGIEKPEPTDPLSRTEPSVKTWRSDLYVVERSSFTSVRRRWGFDDLVVE